jgi:multisubunit Na+/H+ antiporter MnhB subunit
MPRSLILRTISLGLLYIIILFSVFLFLQGHNAPGGGFIAGLIAGGMILIQFLAYSRAELREVFRPIFHRMIGLGVLVAAGSGVFGLLLGEAYLEGFHWTLHLTGGEPLAVPSVLFFDLGIYLVVIGMVVSVFMALEEKSQ